MFSSLLNARIDGDHLATRSLLCQLAAFASERGYRHIYSACLNLGIVMELEHVAFTEQYLEAIDIFIETMNDDPEEPEVIDLTAEEEEGDILDLTVEDVEEEPMELEVECHIRPSS